MPSLRETAREKLQKRAGLITENRALLDLVEKEKREYTADEVASRTARWADIEKLRTDSDELVRQADAEDGIEKTADKIKPEATPERRDAPSNEEPQQRAIRVMREVRAMTEAAYVELPQVRAAGVWFRDGYDGLNESERRALEVTNSAAGGYLQPPQEFIARLIKAVDNLVFIRRLATVYPLPKAESLGVPTLENDPADPTWVGELSTGDADSTMSFGKRELRPQALAQRILVSNTLMRKSALDPETIVRDRIAYKHAVVQENAFLNGTGAAQPLGVFTASADGIPTSRDVSTGNTTSSITFDGLKSAKWSIKSQYWPRLQWIMHPSGGAQVDKLKDGGGQYIWQPSVVVGQPDRLLSFPVNFSEYAPATFTTGLYVGILGDFSFYWIADALDMQIQRLVELYAVTNQTGFISRSETDGMPVLAEAFTRVKLA